MLTNWLCGPPFGPPPDSCFRLYPLCRRHSFFGKYYPCWQLTYTALPSYRSFSFLTPSSMTDIPRVHHHLSTRLNQVLPQKICRAPSVSNITWQRVTKEMVNPIWEVCGLLCRDACSYYYTWKNFYSNHLKNESALQSSERVCCDRSSKIKFPCTPITATREWY